MLHLPKKMLYALEAVVDIAFNARPDPVHDLGMVLGIDQRPDFGLQPESLPEVGLFHASQTPRRTRSSGHG